MARGPRTGIAGGWPLLWAALAVAPLHAPPLAARQEGLSDDLGGARAAAEAGESGLHFDLRSLLPAAVPSEAGEGRAAANEFAPRPHADPLAQPIASPRAARRDSGVWQRWMGEPTIAASVSLGSVFLVYLLLQALVRRGGRRRAGVLPSEIVEWIGYLPTGPRQQLQLLRLGSKLVLVAVSPAGWEALSEVTDPVEVEEILAACRGDRRAEAARAVQRVAARAPRATGRRRGARAVFEA